jgi:hypothetical protein
MASSKGTRSLSRGLNAATIRVIASSTEII